MFFQIYKQPVWLVPFLIGGAILVWAILWMLLGQKKLWRRMNIALAAVYACIVLFGTVILRASGERELWLVPFASLQRAREQPEIYRALAMNVLMFAPVGMTVSASFSQKQSFAARLWRTLVTSLLFSLLIETLQYTLGRGNAETDDLLTNLLGASLGSLYLPLGRCLLQSVKKDEKKMMKEKTECLQAPAARLRYIDCAKGIGMLLIMASHAALLHGKAAAVSGHIQVPIFFFISGFLFNEKKPVPVGRRILEKARSFLIPYFVFALLHIGLYLLMKYAGNDYGEVSPLYCLLVNNTWDMPIHGIQWFLTASFFAFVFCVFLYKIKCVPIRITTAVLICMAGTVLPGLLSITLPLALGPACAAVGLFMLGHGMRACRDKLLCFPWWGLLLAGITVIAFSIFNGYVNMRTDRYGIVPLFYLNAAAGSAVLLLALAKAEPKIGRLWIFREISFIGENSIVYLCLNELAIILNTKAAERLFGAQSGAKRTLMQIGIWLCSIVLLRFAALLFRKKPFYYLIGKSSDRSNGRR